MRSIALGDCRSSVPGLVSLVTLLTAIHLGVAAKSTSSGLEREKKMSTSRELVMDYLWDRILKAWSHQSDDEARRCAEFLAALEGMSDEQFDSEYNESEEVAA